MDCDSEGRKVIVCDNGTGVSGTLFVSERIVCIAFFFSISNVAIVHRVFLISIFHVWLVGH
jgi:hypothetical protein